MSVLSWFSGPFKRYTRGQFLVYRELSAILDAQLFPTFFRPNSWAPFLRLLRPTFYRTLWTVKVNFLVKKLSAVALNYLHLQEIHPSSNHRGSNKSRKFWYTQSVVFHGHLDGLIGSCYFNHISSVFVCCEVTPNQLPVLISLFWFFHKQAMIFHCRYSSIFDNLFIYNIVRFCYCY